MPRTSDPAAIETLRRARELVNEGWTTGAMWRDAAGLPLDLTGSSDPKENMKTREQVATCCAMGGILMAADELSHRTAPALVYFAHIIKPDEVPDPDAWEDPEVAAHSEAVIVGWNDESAWDDGNESLALQSVLETFDRAIA